MADVLFCGAGGIFYKKYSENAKCDKKNLSITFAVLMPCTAAALIFCLSGFSFRPTKTTLFIGLFQALVYFFYTFILMNAYSSGASYALIAIYGLSGATLLPMLESAVFFNNVPEAWKFIPISMVLVSIVLMNLDGLVKHEKKPEDKKKKVYSLYYALLFLASGTYSALLDTHQNLSGGAEKTEFIIVSYVLSALFALFFMAILNRGIKFSEFGQTPRSVIFLFLYAAVSATSIYVTAYLLGRFNAAVTYSLLNGGSLVTATLYATLFFKEKLTFFKAVGILIATAGIVSLTVF